MTNTSEHVNSHGLTFAQWRDECNARLVLAGLRPVISWDKLYDRWFAGETVDHALGLQPTAEARAGSKVLKWANNSHANDTSGPRGVVEQPLYRKTNGERVLGNVRNADLSGVPLEERILDPKCPIDDRIKFAFETLRMKRGNLAHAEYYASVENFEHEMARIGKQIEFLLEYRSRLRYAHTYSSEIQDSLADEVVLAEREHKALLKEKAAKKAEEERLKLERRARRLGDVAVLKNKKREKPKLTIAELLKQFIGDTAPTPEQLALATAMAGR